MVENQEQLTVTSHNVTNVLVIMYGAGSHSLYCYNFV